MNPPYQELEKINGIPAGSINCASFGPNLYAGLVSRSIDLLARGGHLAALTLRSWLFLKDYLPVRERILAECTIHSIGDFDRGAFEDIPDEVVSVCASHLVKTVAPAGHRSRALLPTPRKDLSRDNERTLRKRAATLAHEESSSFKTGDILSVPLKPFIYWWDERILCKFRKYQLIGKSSPAKQGMATANNNRFLRKPWEVHPRTFYDIKPMHLEAEAIHVPQGKWRPYVKGAAGIEWMEPLQDIINYKDEGLESKEYQGSTSGKNAEYYFRKATAFTKIGSSFSARSYRYPSVFDVAGSSIASDDNHEITCLLNSSHAREIIEDLNPTINFQVGDINRLPVVRIEGSKEIHDAIFNNFSRHESSRETSIEFLRPRASSWRSMQKWAQQAVDRPEGAPLPEYIEELDPEPPTDHLSFALGVALGRFAPVDDQGQPTTSNQPGILDPTTADLSHALHAGILFLDGSLEERRVVNATISAKPPPPHYVRPGHALDQPLPQAAVCAIALRLDFSRRCTRACMRTARSTGR